MPLGHKMRRKCASKASAKYLTVMSNAGTYPLSDDFRHFRQMTLDFLLMQGQISVSF